MNAEKMINQFALEVGTEEIEKRGECEKYFDLGNNRHQAVIFSEPVHFRDEETGEWTEIDNTLELDERRGMLRNRANDVHMELKCEAGEGSLVRLTHKGHTLSWSFENQSAQATARISDVAERMETSVAASDAATPLEERLNRLNANGIATYEEIAPNVSVTYTACGKSIKEDIVVQNKEALDNLALLLPADELSYTARENGSVDVRDRKSGESVFEFLAPVVYDSHEGVEPVPAGVMLTSVDGFVRMSYVLDEDFLENALFPITIDPVVRISTSQDTMSDTVLKELNPTTNYGSSTYLYSGVSSSKQNVALLRFKRLLKIRASDTILNAKLQLSYGDANTSYVGAYEIKRDWDPNTATWSNFNPDDPANIDTAVQEYYDGSANAITMDITSLYKQWYMAGKNKGVALRRPAGMTGNNYVSMCSSKYGGSTQTYKPRMIVDYVSHAGKQDWWTYESQSAGRAGEAHADIFNGNLVFTHQDVSMNGARMPVSISHIYNSCLSDSNAYHCGNGWKLNVQQHVVTQAIEGTTYYIWTDGGGTEHYFKKTGSAPYSDMDGMGLKLRVPTGKITIEDKGNTLMSFEMPSGWSKYWLTSVADSLGNTQTYYYGTEGKVQRVDDGAGRQAYLSFTGPGGMLDGISNAAEVRGYGYTNSNLTAIAYSDNVGNTNYAYAGNLLVSARRYDGCEVAIEYEPVSAYDGTMFDGGVADQMRRASSLEYRNGATLGGKRVFTYRHMQTDVANVDGRTIKYQLNAAGNAVCAMDELGFGQFSEFSASVANQTNAASRLQKVVINRVNFPDFIQGWSTYYGNSTISATRDTTVCYKGMPSVKLVNSSSVGHGTHLQDVSVECGKTWTFSAYVKTALTSGSVMPVIIDHTDWGNSTEGERIAYESQSLNDEWTRISATRALTGTGFRTIRIEMALVGTGTIWFAMPQLEEGPVANSVNLLTNGDFRDTVGGPAGRAYPYCWAYGSTVPSTSANGIYIPSPGELPRELSGNYVQLHSVPQQEDIFFDQVVNVTGKKDDAFVAGGWANAHSVPKADSSDRGFRVSVRFQKTDGSWGGLIYLTYNCEWVGWQFGCWPVLAPFDYKAVRYYVSYHKNCNEVKFTNMFLYREEFGNSFAYDANKNVTSVGVRSGQKSNMTYDSFDNLTSYVQPGRASTEKYAMTYGSTDAEKKKHLVCSMTTPMGVVSETDYDAYGNVTKSKTKGSAATPFIQSTVAYADGNYPSSSTDAREYTSYTHYDAAKGTLNSATAPNGQTMNYLYDGTKRLTCNYVLDGSVIYRNDYGYVNDRLQSIWHNTTGWDSDMCIALGYDDLGNPITVTAGGVLLSMNHYSNNRKRLLTRTSYANGGSVSFDYDGFDRVTGKYRNDQINASYEYGANGSVARIKDHGLNRTEKHAYDFAGRPMQLTLTDDANGQTLYRSTTSYNTYNNLSRFKETLGDGRNFATEYTYDKDNRPTMVNYANNHKVTYAYDALGRIQTRTGSNPSGMNHEVKYTYYEGGQGANSTTALVKTITQPGYTLSYEYDNMGNITKETIVTPSGTNTNLYQYDSLGQLTREDKSNWYGGEYFIYQYDRGGNLKKRTCYHSNGAYNWEINYGHVNGWKDQLSSVSGAYNGNIYYDGMGNCTQDHYNQYTWSGRQLTRMRRMANGQMIDLTYNANGALASSTHLGSTPLQYIWNGGQLSYIYESNGNRMKFLYDAQGRPEMLVYHEEWKYHYVYNAQGDVIALLDGNGNKVVEYLYDAYGRMQTTMGKDQALDVLNPFTYRGAYGYVRLFGVELYYLKSRYYSPILSRFLSPDSVLGKVGGLFSHNLYAYCAGNPVMRVDPDGRNAILGGVAGAVIGVVIGVAAGVAVSSSGRITLNFYANIDGDKNIIKGEPGHVDITIHTGGRQLLLSYNKYNNASKGCITFVDITGKGDGRTYSDSSKFKHYAITYLVSPSQITSVLSYIEEHSGKALKNTIRGYPVKQAIGKYENYDVGTMNCSVMAYDVMKSIGLPFAFADWATKTDGYVSNLADNEDFLRMTYEVNP